MEINESTACNECKGLGVVYVGLTDDGLFWKTSDCPFCGGTGSKIDRNRLEERQ